MAEELRELPGPYELFELTDRESKEFSILNWEIGTIRISTLEVPTGKVVKTLRIFVPTADKPIGVNWYDITSQTLIAQLQPYLETRDYPKKRFIITKYGTKPKARFSLEVL